MSTSISRGMLSKIANGDHVDGVPVVRVEEVKLVKANNGDRYKLTVTDDVTSVPAMLATQLNHLVKDNSLVDNCLISLNKYVCNEVSSRKVVILLDVSVVGKAQPKTEPVSHQSIGNPAPPSAPQSTIVKPRQPGGASRQYGEPPAPKVESRPQFGSNGAVVRQHHATGNFMPLRQINPYAKWTFKARVNAKSDIRKWDKGPSNQGQLFSAEVADSDGTEIRMTFFRDAVDKFHDMIQIGGVYSFSNGKLKMANRQYTAVKNEYEITFGPEAEIFRLEDDSSIKTISLNPVAISQIANMSPSDTVDVMGVALEIGQVTEFTSKAGKQLMKLEFTLKDQSGGAIKVTVWGKRSKEISEQLEGLDHPIIAIKTCRVNDYGGRTLNSGDSSVFHIQPDTEEAAALRAWYDREGATSTTTSLSMGGGGGMKGEPKQVHERHITESLALCNIGSSGKPEYVELMGTVGFIKNEKMWYYACPEENNNKKVVRTSDGTWHCEATNQFYNSKVNRYILSMQIQDYSGQIWATAFNEAAIELIGYTADEMETLQESNEAEFNRIMAEATFKSYIFKLRVSDETGSDGNVRKRTTVQKATKIDFVKESNMLLDAIARYD